MVQKTEDMTRSSVQKSVCVICRSPLFGRLAVKMELVVRAWFLQGDFSQTKLLEDAYNHLNSCPVQIDQTLEGIEFLYLEVTIFNLNLFMPQHFGYVEVISVLQCSRFISSEIG